MSRLLHWSVTQNLQSWGWPRTKGTFRKKTYVDAKVVDVLVEGAVRVFVGLGAGRPDIAVRVLADTFAGNPWTAESTAQLVGMLTEDSDDEVANHPDSAPWRALVEDSRIAEVGEEIEWEQLADPQLLLIWSSFGAKGLMWGFNHPELMGKVFDSDKSKYESTAAEMAAGAGLEVGESYPWASLEAFYEACEDFVVGFEAELPALPREIPAMLAKTPEVKRRLG